MSWFRHKYEGRLKISVVKNRVTSTCVVTITGYKGIYDDDSVVGKSTRQLRRLKQWTNLTIDCRDLKPIKEAGFGCDFVAMLLKFLAVAIKRNATWHMTFQNRDQVTDILCLCNLWSIFNGHLDSSNEPAPHSTKIPA